MEEEKVPTILGEVKESLGLPNEVTELDGPIKMFINNAFAILTQLGVGPKEGFLIVSGEEIFTDFMGDGPVLSLTRTYIFAKVRILFDPPTSSAVLECYKEAVKEAEFRLNVMCDKEEVIGG